MRTLTKYWTAFIIIFAIHNTEEVLNNLPEWAHAHGVFSPFTDRATFTFIVILLTGIASIAGYILEYRKARKSATILQIFCWIMVVNSIWHVSVSLQQGSIMPGAISAVVVLPVCGWIAVRARRLRVITL